MKFVHPASQEVYGEQQDYSVLKRSSVAEFVLLLHLRQLAGRSTTCKATAAVLNPSYERLVKKKITKKVDK